MIPLSAMVTQYDTFSQLKLLNIPYVSVNFTAMLYKSLSLIYVYRIIYPALPRPGIYICDEYMYIIACLLYN